jgi:hypothetical protein
LDFLKTEAAIVRLIKINNVKARDCLLKLKNKLKNYFEKNGNVL